MVTSGFEGPEGPDGWAVGLNADGSVYCLVGSQKTHVRATSGVAYRPGTAVDVACGKRPDDVTLYVDGKPVAVDAVVLSTQHSAKY